MGNTLRNSYNHRRSSFTLFQLTVLLATATLLGACFGTKTSGPGQSSDSEAFALTIVARTHHDAPGDFGVEPGDVVVKAEVSVENMEFPDKEVAVGLTDESGRWVLMVTSGTYNVSVKLETHDPKCHWYASSEVAMPNRNSEVSIDDLWVLCE